MRFTDMFRNLLNMFWEPSTAGPALIRWKIIDLVENIGGLKIHHIHSSDTEMHAHPWNGISIIFGYYCEEREWEHGYARRWFFNRVFAHRAHKVIVSKPVWTIFINGPRRNKSWRYGDKEVPWRGPDSGRMA